MTGLTLRGVSHTFGDRTVLRGVDVDVPGGTVVGLLGPNGAGKTTLMRIVFGILDPDAGRVEWDGRPATPADRRAWGYMPQERGLYREMRTLDHLVWLARLQGVDRATATARANDLLERLGLADRGRDPIRDLSGGMAQRVQLAAAMVHGPKLLVLDEPFAGLDPVATEFLSDIVISHVDAGGHLLFSSHQLDLVQDLCETIVMIDGGDVVLSGEVRALRAASPDRILRVDIEVDARWLDGLPAGIAESSPAGSRVVLEPGADAADVLDAIRAGAGRVGATVTDFGVEAPSLSELFLATTGHHVREEIPA